MKKRTALLSALSVTALFFLFLFLQYRSFAPAGVTVHPEHRSVFEDARLDLNTADGKELQQLPGIGPVLSEAIVTWREEHGGFRSAEELTEVPGIGEKTFAGLRDYVYVRGSDSPEDSGG